MTVFTEARGTFYFLEVLTVRAYFQARLVNLLDAFLLSRAFYQGLNIYYALLFFTCWTRTYKLETKQWAGLRQFAKNKFMYMGLSQMEARILTVKLHQKLTSIINIALNKGGKAKERLLKQLFSINSVILRKGASKGDSRDNQLQLTNCPAYQNKKMKNLVYA